jgi:hypothetical protein
VLSGDRGLASQHRLASVRAHLHAMAGDTEVALAGYEDAARRITSIPSSGTCASDPNGYASMSRTRRRLRPHGERPDHEEHLDALHPADLPEHRSLERALPGGQGRLHARRRRHRRESVRDREWVGGEGLADAAQAWSTRVRDGVVMVTDGPFLEA